jgi:CheY-like chemotaxis protein
MESDASECRAAGMDDFIGKPISRALLAEILRRWLPAETLAPAGDAEA